MSGVPDELLSRRDAAVLRAVAAGRGRLARGCEPVLYVDGRPCCDSAAAARFVTGGLVEPGPPGGDPAPAVLTAAGRAALDSAYSAA